MAMARSADFKTPVCRLSYAQGLFKPRAMDNGPAKFGCTLIFDLAARKELEQYVKEVIIAQWGDKGIERAKKGLIKSPFLAGDGKEAMSKKTGELSPGMGKDVFFIRVTAGEDRPPFVIWKSPNIQETEANVYSGCYGKAVLNAFAWHNDKSGDGVSFGVQGFQRLRDGERLGGGGATDPKDWAESIEDTGDAPEETRAGAGAGALFGS